MKKASRLLTLLLILSLLFALGYMALESGHDCHGDVDCPICKVIAIIAAMFGALCVLLLSFAVFFRSESKPSPERSRADFVTPVDLKVKLLN